MRILKKILMGLFIVFIIIQFIRPAHNTSGQVLPTDITKIINVPGNILSVLKNSCYDCHSNNTRYPWYINIQPMGWIMANHIKDGKANLNFSEFGSYSKRKQANKLRAIAKSINDGSMPISSYTIMHTDAKLSEENKKNITNWVTHTKDSMEIKN
ncbi:MAG: heme-binding domain-containing protein [Bacteroidota bacterium]|nr:heme-binding domain-containing protein [Bacteroidota bacterium]